MPEDLESRFDKLEAWELAEEAVKREQAEVEARRHTHIQLATSIVSTLAMLINLYLTLHHGK